MALSTIFPLTIPVVSYCAVAGSFNKDILLCFSVIDSNTAALILTMKYLLLGDGGSHRFLWAAENDRSSSVWTISTRDVSHFGGGTDDFFVPRFGGTEGFCSPLFGKNEKLYCVGLSVL